jgi:peroxiredoxin
MDHAEVSMFRRLQIAGALLVCAFILFSNLTSKAADVPTTQPAPLPRYWLPVGRHLIYSYSDIETDLKSGKSTPDKGTSDLTVVGDNPDGSKRLIAREVSQGEQAGSAPEVQLDYASIFTDGRTPGDLQPNDWTTAPLDSVLPADENQLKHGWTHTNAIQKLTQTYRPDRLDDKQFIFKSAESGMMDTIYLLTFERTIYFDRTRGVVTRVSSRNTQDYGFHSKEIGQSDLKTDEMIPLPAVRALDQELTVYQAALKSYNAEMDKAASGAPASADALYAKAKSDLALAALGATLPDIKAQYQRDLAQHDEYVREDREEQGRRVAIIDKPAFDFSTKDVDGKPHKLSDYRGKVVVLDFWYRGCGWCMFAMPQIKQVVNDFKDQPVAVMGMNVDKIDDDARFVINVQKLNYPTLKSTFPEAKQNFGVQVYPTLIVIDQQGVVRDIEVGYGPKLRDNLEIAIRKLLKSPNATS